MGLFFNSSIICVGSRADRTLLIVLLILLGAILTATVIPGVFIIDEDNYLVNVVGLRHGQLSVPGTEGLTPSKELVYFDPEVRRRVVDSTPVVSLAPPLYAFVALPFSYAGWRGLVLLNTLSFLVAIYFVFRYVEQLTRKRASPWIASVLFALGSYCIEYAQGLWPEMLSVVLCVGSVVLCMKARQNGHASAALIAGILVGLATGIREQNIFLAGCVGVGLLLFGKRKFRNAIAYAVGVVLLLIVIATLNYYRLGIWHPFPKVMSYTHDVAATATSASIFEPLRVFWSKVVDYPSYGPNTAHIRTGYYQWDESSRTALMNGIVKKSWIQSSPWIGLSLIGLIVAWFGHRSKSSETIREIQVLGLIIVPTLLMFSVAGFDRTDGLAFNQRYFVELLPLCAIALVLYLDRVQFSMQHVGIGFMVGVFIVVGVLVLPSITMAHIGQRYVPLLLGLALLAAWYLVKDLRFAIFFLGVCTGWAFFYHLESDLVGSRFRRQINAGRLEILQKIIPDHSALFTYWGNKDAASPLQLNKDVVILDTWADDGQDAELLEKELQDRDRRIFILENDMPGNVLQGLMLDRSFSRFSEGNVQIVENLGKKDPKKSN